MSGYDAATGTTLGRGPQGPVGPAGPQGASGQQTAALVQSTAVTLGRAAHLDPADKGKVRSMLDAARRFFVGLFTTTQASGTQQTYTQGPIPTSLIDLGAGRAEAVGVNSSGVPVRVSDPSCVSRLNFLGHCDEAGAMFLAPRRADRYEAEDFGLVPDWNGVTGTDNLAAITDMLAAMKRDATATGSLNRFQVAHFAGSFYFSGTIHVQQGVVIQGNGDGDPLLYDGYWWCPGTEFVFPPYVHGIRLHSQGDSTEYPPSGVVLAEILSIDNPLGGAVTVTTTGPHGLSTGARVYVGIVYYGQANLRDVAWPITVTGGSTFTLDGAVGDGTATTGTKVIGTDVWTNPGAGGGYPSSGRSRVEGLTLRCKTPNDVCGMGIMSTVGAALAHVHAESFGSNLFAMVGDHTSNGGNSNGWSGRNITGGVGGLHGWYASGGDANAGCLLNGNFALCYGHAVLDAYNLGNTYINVQAAGCGSGGNENGPFVDFVCNGNAASVLIGCYSEIHKSRIDAPAVVIGGNLATESRQDPASTSVVLNGAGSFRGPIVQYDYTTGQLLLSQSGSNDNTGTFALWARDSPASYLRWYLRGDVIYAEQSNSSSARHIGFGMSADAIRSGAGVEGNAPILQNGIFFGEVGFSPQKVDYGSAAPTSGPRQRGDVRYNTLPSAGGNVGWVCVTSGSPGNWKTFGVIEA